MIRLGLNVPGADGGGGIRRGCGPGAAQYEPYDARLWSLGQSLAGVVTSADRTDPISLRRLRLVLSRRVRLQIRLQNRRLIYSSFPLHALPRLPYLGLWLNRTTVGYAEMAQAPARACSVSRFSERLGDAPGHRAEAARA